VASANVIQFSEKITEFIELYCEMLETDGVTQEQVKRAEELERETDGMRKHFNKESMKRMSEETGSVQTEMITIEIHNQFEAIGNYALAVVRTAYFLTHEDDVPERDGA
jgi:Na+/phosphate symporter